MQLPTKAIAFGWAVVVGAAVGASSCRAPLISEVSAVRARPTAEVSRWMTSSTEPVLDAAAVESIPDERNKLGSVGLPAFGLYASDGSARSVVETYLREQLDGADITTEPPTSWYVPGVQRPFQLVAWTAGAASGDTGSGEALTYRVDGTTFVIEVRADGIELGGLLAAVVDGELNVTGYVGLTNAEPFTVQVEDPMRRDEVGGTNVARSDGQSALIEASSSADDVLVTRVRVDDPNRPTFSATIAGIEQVGTQPLSFIERLRVGAAGFKFDPSDDAPSQSSQDAAAQGVPADVAALPFGRRVTPIGRASGGYYQAQIESTLRWSMSRLPASFAGAAELLLIEEGVDRPAAIRRAIELGVYRPSWVSASETHVYAGRRAENDPTAMVLRAKLDGSELVVVAQTDSPDELPDGWTPATPEQVAAIEELVNYAPDVEAVDAIIDGTE